MAPLLDVKDLHVEFMTRDGVVKAVNGITFALERGKVLTILGESGSGKRHLALSRQVAAQGQDTALGESCPEGDEPLRAFRGGGAKLRGSLVAMIFQEPMTALDPVYTVGEQIVETLVRHQHMTRAQARRRALELFELVQIPSPAAAAVLSPRDQRWYAAAGDDRHCAGV